MDDDPTSNEVKRMLLKNAGHEVDICLSADDAVCKLGQTSYDALVTDWRLGEESARRVIQAARNLANQTLVVVVSVFIAEAFQSQGPVADLYLDKPVDPNEFLMILDALLWERSMHAEQAINGPT